VNLIKSTARLFKNKLFYIIIAISFISIVLNDIKDYELLRFGEFNEAFEKIGVLKKDGEGNFVWLFGNDLIHTAYNNSFNPTIKDLLTKYPVEGEIYGSYEFIYSYKPNVISLIIPLIILMPFYLIIILGISSIALLNKKWDFDKTANRVLIAIIIFLIISFTGNINN